MICILKYRNAVFLIGYFIHSLIQNLSNHKNNLHKSLYWNQIVFLKYNVHVYILKVVISTQ